MLQVDGKKSAELCDGLTRRDFLRVGALGASSLGLSLADLTRLRAAAQSEVNCIVLLLVGGPSQIDTWDPKPDAPDTIRGPFLPIRTNVSGIQIAETFPEMAKMAHRFALIRSVHHDAAPIHETGQQLMQTGRLAEANLDFPHYGAVLSALRGRRLAEAPPCVVLPSPLGETGVSTSHGQGAGCLGAGHEPVVIRGDPASGEFTALVDDAHRDLDANGNSSVAYDRIFSGKAKQAFALSRESVWLRDRYGRSTFGQSCLLARRLIEAGVRLVTVNMFETVFDQVTWDCHADGGALSTTLDDYRRTLCPMFDSAYTTLLEDLAQRGMLENTLVLAMGEFGRTPQINPRGGRDHWPGCWSVLFAGAGVRGGQVIGASDAIASEPRQRPVTPAEIAASVYHTLGIDPATRLSAAGGSSYALSDAAPVAELFHG